MYYDVHVIMNLGSFGKIGRIMILVHLSASWPMVQAGKITPEDATLGDWADLNEDKLGEYADAVLGVYQNAVVSAYDITGWSRKEQGRVLFHGCPSERWTSLIGTPNPGKPWVRGMARPIQYLDTRVVLAETAGADPEHRRAKVGDFTLALGEDGTAMVTAPPGARVIVQTVSHADLVDSAWSAAWGLAKGGDLDARDAGKVELLKRLDALEAAERFGFHIDLDKVGIGAIYTRSEIEALP
ncbi:hypothetical protein [Nocardia salmonicida]|uniref:hypothetical protein n=1 Tax=Nocardia salmonicida TaxID=53431 RepID=UPI0033EFAF81